MTHDELLLHDEARIVYGYRVTSHQMAGIFVMNCAIEFNNIGFNKQLLIGQDVLVLVDKNCEPLLVEAIGYVAEDTTSNSSVKGTHCRGMNLR